MTLLFIMHYRTYYMADEQGKIGQKRILLIFIWANELISTFKDL